MVAHSATTVRVTHVGRIRPIFPHRPHHPIVIGHLHHHHWIFRGGRWVDIEGVAALDAAPVTPAVAAPVTPAVTPGPCTCLTKTYTPTGLVVFADICTKESASAPATDDTADASEAPSTPVPANATPLSEVPTKQNYAGKTYEDYLAANPQTKPEASVQDPQPN